MDLRGNLLLAESSIVLATGEWDCYEDRRQSLVTDVNQEER